MKEKTGLSKKDAEQAVNAMLDTVTEELVKGGKVQIVGFGTFEVRSRTPARAVTPAPMSPSPLRLPNPLLSKPVRRLKKLWISKDSCAIVK